MLKCAMKSKLGKNHDACLVKTFNGMNASLILTLTVFHL